MLQFPLFAGVVTQQMQSESDINSFIKWNIWNNFAVCITWVMLDFPLLFASVVKQ